MCFHWILNIIITKSKHFSFWCIPVVAVHCDFCVFVFSYLFLFSYFPPFSFLQSLPVTVGVHCDHWAATCRDGLSTSYAYDDAMHQIYYYKHKYTIETYIVHQASTPSAYEVPKQKYTIQNHQTPDIYTKLSNVTNLVYDVSTL